MLDSQLNAAVSGLKDQTQLVTFMLQDEEFAFDIMSVQEIIRPPKLSKVPNTPSYVQGIANLRGVVLPIIDMRPRFGMAHVEDTDHTRVLVIDVNGVKSGLRVDRVKQVTNVSSADLEAPPSALLGSKTNYLNGVLKLEAGARLIMSLDAAKVCDLREEATPPVAKTPQSAASPEQIWTSEAISDQAGSDTLQQLVSFQVAREEFAFPMDRVREILRVQTPTKVPDVPDYVLGVLTVRGRLLPILDLRSKLGLQSMAEEAVHQCNQVRQAYERWHSTLMPNANPDLSLLTSNIFSSWVAQFSSSSQVLMDAVMELRTIDDKLSVAAKHWQLSAGAHDVALAREMGTLGGIAREMVDAMRRLEELIPLNLQEDQRIVVVDASGILLGLVVDHVNEVLQVPSKTVDAPPPITAGDGREVSGIARLDDGKRLLLLLDPAKLLNANSLHTLRESSGEGCGQADTEAQMQKADFQGDEVQLVTFMLGDEEYGIPIERIQEIDRLSRVTKIPKAGNCVEGVTNLRGEVIPVINTRKRFELEPRDPDDQTRIIIVDLNGVKTGLIVDSVREVLSVSRSDITAPPSSIRYGADQQFISGIGKLDNGKRMIFVLTAEELLPKQLAA